MQQGNQLRRLPGTILFALLYYLSALSVMLSSPLLSVLGYLLSSPPLVSLLPLSAFYCPSHPVRAISSPTPTNSFVTEEALLPSSPLLVLQGKTDGRCGWCGHHGKRGTCFPCQTLDGRCHPPNYVCRPSAWYYYRGCPGTIAPLSAPVYALR